MKQIKHTNTFTVYQPETNGTFKQWFSEALGVKESDVENELKKHVFTDKQIDRILKDGKENGLEMTGWGNLFPVLRDGEVSVVDVVRGGGRWRRRVYGLDDGFVWGRGNRLVLSNSDTSTLEPLIPSDLEARVRTLEDLVESIKKLLTV